MSDPTPQAAFAFQLKLQDHDLDIYRFQEVQGLAADLQTTQIVEGGENRFAHRLPKRVKHANLVLKRGLVAPGSALAAWCRSMFDGGLARPVAPRDLSVSLLDPGGSVLADWAIGSAYPVKWSVGGSDAASELIEIETLELAYTTLTRIT